MDYASLRLSEFAPRRSEMDGGRETTGRKHPDHGPQEPATYLPSPGRQPDSLFVMRLTGGARVNEGNAGGVRYVVVPSATIETTGAQEHGLRFRDPDGGKHIRAESRARVTAQLKIPALGIADGGTPADAVALYRTDRNEP